MRAEVPDGADKSVYGQAGHVQLFLKDLEDDHGEEVYEEVGADAVGSLQGKRGGASRNDLVVRKRCSISWWKRAGTQHVDGVVVERGAVGRAKRASSFISLVLRDMDMFLATSPPLVTYTVETYFCVVLL